MVAARPKATGEQREEVAEDHGADEGDGRDGERCQSGLLLDDPGQARAEDEPAEDTGGVRARREDAEREHTGQGHAEEPGDRQEQIPGLGLTGGREVERDRDGQEADDDDDGAGETDPGAGQTVLGREEAGAGVGGGTGREREGAGGERGRAGGEDRGEAERREARRRSG